MVSTTQSTREFGDVRFVQSILQKSFSVLSFNIRCQMARTHYTYINLAAFCSDPQRAAQQREGFMTCMNAVLEQMRRVCELEESTAAAACSGRESPARRLTHVIHDRLAAFLNSHFAPESEKDASPTAVPVPSAAAAVHPQADIQEPHADIHPLSPLSPSDGNSLSQQSLSCMSCPAALQLQRPVATQSPSDVDTENSQTLLLPPPPLPPRQQHQRPREFQRPLSSDSDNSADSCTRLSSSSCTCFSARSDCCDAGAFSFTVPQVGRVGATWLPVSVAATGSKRSFAIVPQRPTGSGIGDWRGAVLWPSQVARVSECRPPPAKVAHPSDLKFSPLWRPWEC